MQSNPCLKFALLSHQLHDEACVAGRTSSDGAAAMFVQCANAEDTNETNESACRFIIGAFAARLNGQASPRDLRDGVFVKLSCSMVAFNKYRRRRSGGTADVEWGALWIDADGLYCVSEGSAGCVVYIVGLVDADEPVVVSNGTAFVAAADIRASICIVLASRAIARQLTPAEIDAVCREFPHSPELCGSALVAAAGDRGTATVVHHSYKTLLCARPVTPPLAPSPLWFVNKRTRFAGGSVSH